MLTTKQLAIESLKLDAIPNNTLYIVLKHRSKSGMMRKLQVLIPHNDKILDITYDVAIATGEKIDKNNYLIVRGCGTDVGELVAQNLSCALFGSPDEFECKWL